MFQARARVIYGDTDQMGVVYYANYLRFFELARSEFLIAHGRSYRDVEAEGFSLPVVEATCRYLLPARYENVLLIGVEVPEVSRVRLTFRYEVTREGDPRVLCTGTTIHACLGKTGRPARLPDWVVALVTPSTG